MLAGKGALCFLDDEDSRISSLRSAWERLGGEVTDDLAEATFIVCDDPSNPRCAQVLLGGEALVFSSNFVVQCVAQGRVVNGGPFIQHPVPVSVQNNSPGRGKQRHGRRGNSDDNDDDVGSSVEVLLKETPRVSEVPNLDKRTQKQQTTPIARPAKRAAAVKAAAANSSVLKTKSRSRLATAKRDGDEDRSNDELAVRKVVSAKKQRVASSSAAARAPPNGIEQTLRLGVDIGADMDLDDLVAEFSDFFPNENGATVRPIMFKG